MGKLTTHILDTASGKPAAGVVVALFGDGGILVTRTVTNHDGRVDAPLLAGDTMQTGQYRITFAVGDYYRRLGTTLPEPAFLDVVPIEFGIADRDAHYHVPLLISPYGYSTYRGS